MKVFLWIGWLLQTRWWFRLIVLWWWGCWLPWMILFLLQNLNLSSWGVLGRQLWYYLDIQSRAWWWLWSGRWVIETWPVWVCVCFPPCFKYNLNWLFLLLSDSYAIMFLFKLCVWLRRLYVVWPNIVCTCGLGDCSIPRGKCFFLNQFLLCSFGCSLKIFVWSRS